MKNWLLFTSVLLICTSCDMPQTEAFNHAAYEEYRFRSSGSCGMIDGNCLYVDMNKPNFEFYLEDEKLNFNGLQNLDTFLTNNKALISNHRIGLLGKEYVKNERLDSVFSLFQKHKRSRYLLLYQRGFLEK